MLKLYQHGTKETLIICKDKLYKKGYTITKILLHYYKIITIILLQNTITKRVRQDQPKTKNYLGVVSVGNDY